MTVDAWEEDWSLIKDTEQAIKIHQSLLLNTFVQYILNIDLHKNCIMFSGLEK